MQAKFQRETQTQKPDNNHLCPSGDRRRAGERERRRGDGDLRLRGERLTLRREDDLGLVSRDLSLPGPVSVRRRFLKTHQGTKKVNWTLKVI